MTGASINSIMVFISLQSVMDARLFIVTKGVCNKDVRGRGLGRDTNKGSKKEVL